MVDWVSRQIEDRGVADPAVLRAMRRVPRPRFVPAAEQGFARGDFPLPIGRGQTISQPYIVAFMTELLRLESHSRVLEVGTGSGYQAAVLAEIVREVFSVEILPDLADSAAARLLELGYLNVRVKQGDGGSGWPEEAPFSGIVVTAVAPGLPEPLLEQLAPGGRMVIPLGKAQGVQELHLVEKADTGCIRSQAVMGVRFVPLTGGYGDPAVSR